MRVAVVGAGPAGIYTADSLSKSVGGCEIDLFDRMPAPFGLVRYGVAPDHPRIKQIVHALHRVLDTDGVRLFGNVTYGRDIGLDDLRALYDAVVFATGCERDRDLDVPGIDLPGSHGAAEFVRWYDGHPDVAREWTLDAGQVGVIGAGNVALDVARILAKDAADLADTEIPATVAAGLAANPATDVHVFARRGIAHARFTPMELRELDHVPGLDVVVDPADTDVDEASEGIVRASKQTQMVVRTLQDWAIREHPGGAATAPTPSVTRASPRRLHLHFGWRPVEVLGEDRVAGLRVERTRPVPGARPGVVEGTGELRDVALGAVYRAVGYIGSHLPELPFDHDRGVVPHDRGRVLDLDGTPLPGVYAVGWIKRGPVGLIGHTKGCAAETVAALLADGSDRPARPAAHADAVVELLESRDVEYTTREGWRRLDEHERSLGARQGRERTKVVPRDEMIALSAG